MYKCETCDKEYKTKKWLIRHINTIHNLSEVESTLGSDISDLVNEIEIYHTEPIVQKVPNTDGLRLKEMFKKSRKK